MGVRIGSAPPATAPSSELKDRASRLPTPGAASTSLEGTYGRELVHRIVAHLLHLLGSFGFVGPAKVTEGLDVMLADPDAMLGATFAAFDANGDGAIDATDLATTLSLARPFFGVPHAELVAKFDAVLRGAGGPRGPKARHGIRRSDLDSVLMYTPALEAWTLTPMRATASWLRGRAETEAHADDAGWRRGLAAAPEHQSPPPPPPRLRPPPNGASRRAELTGATSRREPAVVAPAMRSMAGHSCATAKREPRRSELIKPRGPQDDDDDDDGEEDGGAHRGAHRGVDDFDDGGDGARECSPGDGGKGGWVANWAKTAAEQFFKAAPMAEHPRPESPSILKPSGSFVALRIGVEGDGGDEKGGAPRRRSRRRSSVTWCDDDEGAGTPEGTGYINGGNGGEDEADAKDRSGDRWGVRSRTGDGDDSSSYASLRAMHLKLSNAAAPGSSDVSSTLGGGSQSALSASLGASSLAGADGTHGAAKAMETRARRLNRKGGDGTKDSEIDRPTTEASVGTSGTMLTCRTMLTEELTEEERVAREEEKERVIEQKMREEIEAKQLASLTGKAHQKEWNYAMYENRKRRIPRNLVKPPLYASIERAAYEKFMEDEERRERREALGLFD